MGTSTTPDERYFGYLVARIRKGEHIERGDYLRYLQLEWIRPDRTATGGWAVTTKGATHLP